MIWLIIAYLFIGALLNATAWFLVRKPGPILWELLAIIFWPLVVGSAIFYSLRYLTDLSYQSPWPPPSTSRSSAED